MLLLWILELVGRPETDNGYQVFKEEKDYKALASSRCKINSAHNLATTKILIQTFLTYSSLHIATVMEVDMAGTAVPVDWPTLLWRQQGEAQDASNIDHNRNPAWTMPTASPIRSCGTSMQPDLYLQLSHILEWEIWNHNQTRGYLTTERDKVSELNAQVWRLSRDIEQWRDACQQGYAAIDQHRAENVELKRALAEARVRGAVPRLDPANDVLVHANRTP